MVQDESKNKTMGVALIKNFHTYIDVGASTEIHPFHLLKILKE